MLIGTDDPHETTNTATAVEPGSHQEVPSIFVDAALREYRRMLTWAQRRPQRRWAIENAKGLGRQLASWLLAGNADVVDESAWRYRHLEMSTSGRGCAPEPARGGREGGVG